MQLTNCGITVEIENPIDIAQYKKLGYIEVIETPIEAPKDEQLQREPKPVKRSKKKAVNNG